MLVMYGHFFLSRLLVISDTVANGVVSRTLIANKTTGLLATCISTPNLPPKTLPVID